MILIRHGAIGQEKQGVEVEVMKYDVSPLVMDYNEDFFA